MLIVFNIMIIRAIILENIILVVVFGRIVI